MTVVLQVDGLSRRVRQGAGAARRVAEGRARRVRRLARRQRCRQVDAAQDDRRAASGSTPGPSRSTATTSPPSVPRRSPVAARSRAGGTPAVRADDRHREPAARCPLDPPTAVRGGRPSRPRADASSPSSPSGSRQRADSMSGGEQQMLAIGRCLMSQPRVVLLDEPSLGLAPMVVESRVRHGRRRSAPPAPRSSSSSRTH